MAHPFFWYELMTDDVDAAAAFYARAIGWKTTDFPLPGSRYVIVGAGERGVGGIMRIPAEAAAGGMKPGWVGYVHVDDVDAAAERVAAAGGRILTPPEDIPGDVGRFATVADPQGAMFMLMRPNGPDTPPLAPATPGAVGWRELQAADARAALDFYADQFGWTKAGEPDVGMLYILFSAGGAGDGGMMNRMDPASPPHWLFYFTVDAVDAAVERIEAAGGRLVHGPHPVPGGSWVAACVDPQGARFSITAAKR